MTESNAWARITAYMAESRLNTALEAEVQQNLAVEAKVEKDGTNMSPIQRFDCIYDDEPLGFERDPLNETPKMQAQDPLEEIDIGNGSVKRPTYISANISPDLKGKLVQLLKEFSDCFAWDYNEKSGLSREMVELKLPIKAGKRPVKQLPRRFAPEIMSKIKEEIERLLKSKFIRTARYVEWLANIVPVIKKNGTLRVCIDFRDLNSATPKNEYVMPVAEMLVDSAAGFEFLSMLDGYSGYKQIFIAEEDVSKTAFRCPGALGTYEWVVMPFGLKNAGATYQRAMNSMFHDFIDTFMQVYIDDIIIKSSSEDSHLLYLRQSFERMRKHGLKMNPLKCAFCVHAGDFLGKVNFLRRFISNLSGKAQAFSPLLRLKKDDPFKWNEEHQKAFDDIKDYLIKPPVLMPPNRNKAMKLYIAASEKTIGSMLAQEDDNGIENAVYYHSRVLNDAETRYTAIEKLCLCLYFSCTKLKHYIKPVDVYVYSQFDVIKHMLTKPILHSRIGKWALALTEYSLTYKPLKAVKGQIVADFIVDHSLVEMPQEYVDIQPWILYFDGSKHKHGTGIGILIISPTKVPTKFKYKINGLCSNNEAEYEALITGLEILKDLGAKNIRIRGDYELVLKQLTQEYKCVKEHLAKYFVIASSLLNCFDHIDIEHVPRLENQEANDLAQIASGYKVSKEKLAQLIEIKEKMVLQEPISEQLSMPKLVGADIIPQINDEVKIPQENFEIFAIDNLSDNDWRKPIMEYLRNPTGNVDRKIKYRALSYIVFEDDLFKKTYEGILLKCLNETEAYIAISDVHSDCIEYAKGCQECQRHSGIQHVPASELHSIVKPWPFRGWALDLIGEIKPASSKNQRYILVGIDYFTKWIEAIPLPNVDQEAVISFIQNHVIYRFGIPETITTDQVEIHLQSARVQRQMEIPLDHYYQMMSDELVDLDEERLSALEILARQKEKVARAYNKKVKSKSFNIGDLVWKVILPMDKKDRVLGKWSPNWEGPFKVVQVYSNGAYEIEELTPEKRTLGINGKYLKEYKPTLLEVKISAG
ncbi:hypothetical protein QL285_062925 [Trifolium repens]|nr:hypothetical protein QL285_062925 [Trifolium repens]